MTILSDRESQITKLDRVHIRAKAFPNTVFNNLEHVITEELLHEAFSYLGGGKAIGIDGVRKKQYELELHENIKKLVMQIRRGQYHPKAARIVQIPKEDGSTRPLTISCFEDKLVQWAVSKILEAIYEPVFLPCSYGFRPKLNCHEALRSLMRSTYVCKDGALIEIDIRKCFNRIPHDQLLTFLQVKITDKRFLRLVQRLITAPILEGEESVMSSLGCPQGSIVSPILCNIFLHHVIDEWFSEVSKSHLKGRTELIRYADDMVFIFERMEDAKRIFQVLSKRLEKYGLEMHEAKSALLPSGNRKAERLALKGEKMPTFMFLGFTCYWGKTQKGFWRLKVKSRKDRYTETLKRLRKFLRDNLTSKDTELLLKSIVRRVRGWINYHAVTDNQRRVKGFLYDVEQIIFKWFGRRSQRKAIDWPKFNLRLNQVGYPKVFKITSLL